MILTENGVPKLMQRIKSFITAQLNTKANSVHTHTLSEIDDLSSLQMGGGIPLSGSNQISGDLIPSTDGTVNLGSSSKKFASLNGIAPDELGLLTSTYTDVSSYITHFDGVTPNHFTAPVSGLLYIQGGVTGTTVAECTVNNDTKKYNVVVPFGFGCIRGLVPVEQGDEIYIHIAHLSNLADAKIHHLKGKI